MGQGQPDHPMLRPCHRQFAYTHLPATAYRSMAVAHCHFYDTQIMPARPGSCPNATVAAEVPVEISLANAAGTVQSGWEGAGCNAC